MSEILAAIPTEVKTKLSVAIASAAAQASSKVFDKAKVSLEIGFAPFLHKSYDKCRYYKTVLNSYEPCDLIETYVHVSLKRKSTNFEERDDAAINSFLDGERFIVTGLAGCGKSMLMKHASLQTFHNSNKIPLFIELRKINSVSKSPNVIDFVYQECSPIDPACNIRQFKMALKSGLFALILDGFDEIDYSYRRSFIDQLNNLCIDYPKCPVIISSRPDRDFFRELSHFYVLEVEAFDKRQALELISHAKCDEELKNRFVKALHERLFQTHQSFLQSPLLTIIMLLTFEEYANIPNQMHSFYSRAFDTLFQKHDAAKDQYVRKMRTGLSREDFKLVLSAFCASAHVEEDFSFNKDLLTNYVLSALSYAKNVNDNIDVNEEDYIGDLKDAVCLIQEDGLNYVFVHRSFQEYFAACFIEKIHPSKIRNILNRFSHRLNDNVISMSYAMSRETVESEWILPTLDHFINILDRKLPKVTTGSIFSKIVPRVSLYYNFDESLNQDDDLALVSRSDRISVGFDGLNINELGPLEAICGEFRKEFGFTYLVSPLVHLELKKLEIVTKKETNTRLKNHTRLKNFCGSEKDVTKHLSIDITSADSWWLDGIGAGTTIDKIHKSMVVLRKKLLANSRSRSSILDDMLIRSN